MKYPRRLDPETGTAELIDSRPIYGETTYFASWLRQLRRASDLKHRSLLDSVTVIYDVSAVCTPIILYTLNVR
jgi:hypothetical protein